ncbi:MAG TPA: hypothetical protein VLX09_07285 [Stellaceae bacterium]|nr:hypothetical protein [Stellaceae bacterium]
MDFAKFKASLTLGAPPAGIDQALNALWWDAKGDWKKAHECAQKDEGANGAWVHAYLHRREGDISNAGHWYRRAGKRAADGTLEAEWEAIAHALLARA